VNRSVRVVAIGECMVELRATSPSAMAVGFGGDTGNTAVYLAHYGGADRAIDTHYMTFVGDDPHGSKMITWLESKGVGTELIRVLPNHTTGLYIVDVDNTGECHFVYHRAASAARQLFSDPCTPAISEADWIYLSGITIAILNAEARRNLCDTLDNLRAGGAKIAFDTNFRPRLWDDTDEARSTVTEFLRRTDLVLPTYADEYTLFGDPTPQHTVERLHRIGIKEAAVKLGRDGALVSNANGQQHIPPHPTCAVDTTAAGDAFNAGYLNARLRGADPVAAGFDGARLAATVVGHPGAILEPSLLPRLSHKQVAR
jgi:2-dehydro-3-deoxygluconokinase